MVGVTVKVKGASCHRASLACAVLGGSFGLCQMCAASTAIAVPRHDSQNRNTEFKKIFSVGLRLAVTKITATEAAARRA